MLDAHKQEFLQRNITAAQEANHIFPAMAAAESALESGFGTSGLSIRDNNLFGMKQHQHPIYGTEVLPTREFEKGEWIVVNADWVKYPSTRECFIDRMNTLKRLSTAYEHYRNALNAKDAINYVTEVSKTWSTDPNRAQKVIDIYNAFHGTQAVAA